MDLFKQLLNYVDECDKLKPREPKFVDILNQRLAAAGAYTSGWYQTYSGLVIFLSIFMIFID
jgi:hypothetical protein